MLRSKITPLILNSSTKAIFRRQFSNVVIPSSIRTAIVPRNPSKMALQLARTFQTTAIVKQATIVYSRNNKMILI